jgi:hypothetical protein
VKALIDPATFAAVFAALYAAHEVADHWLQTRHLAFANGAAGRRGRVACAMHVATLTATKVLVLGVVAVLTGVGLEPWAVAVGLGVDAVSHYWADRQTTLVALADRIGKGEFVRLGDGAAAPVGTGAYALDQSWHMGWLLVAALLVSVGAS